MEKRKGAPGEIEGEAGKEGANPRDWNDPMKKGQVMDRGSGPRGKFLFWKTFFIISKKTFIFD